MLFIVFLISLTSSLFAASREINLVVDYKAVDFTGKYRTAIAVNHQIPAPILHFREGDEVTINVYNRLNEETAIHWHGILVPWQMDGVLGISQKGIQPGQSFRYHFTLNQSGTYWYHAHAGLQEQQGLYGAFLIDPRRPPGYAYTREYVIVLSDWSNTNPEQILANLKKEGDYYSPRFPLQPSLAKFIHDYRKANPGERQLLINDYKMMQDMRMSIYDISDVAYDAFLLNGQSNHNPWMASVKQGDIVRLRFIGAGGSTLFRVKIPGTTMQMVHVQGNDVEPYSVSDFTIAPGETYDVLVPIKQSRAYIIYAESVDTLGAAYGALITAPGQSADFNAVAPFPEPPPVTREMMANMMPSDINHGMASSTSMQMNHSMPSMPNKPMAMNHSMPTEPSIPGDSIISPDMPQKSGTAASTKYQPLRALTKTNDINKPVTGVIRMELFGYMDRFIWFINGVPEYKAKPIVLDPARRYRIVFTNSSMMHHPMHIHGHWFILRKGAGSYDPLLHTIDVAPGATMVADIDTDASGQWFFHCHLLYHMVAGMSRVFQYSTLLELTKKEAKPQDLVRQTAYHNRPIVRVDETRPIDVSLVRHPMAHPSGWWFADFFDVGMDPFHNVQEVTFKGLYGGDYHKLQLLTEDAEINKGKIENADIDIFYWRLLSQFWALKGGANYFYRPARVPYWQPGIGVEGLMPYFIDTNARGYYYAGSAKMDIELSRDTQITNNFFIRLGIRSILATKTVVRAQIGSGLNQMRYLLRPYYRLMPGLNLFAEYEHDQEYGAFKRFRTQDGEPVGENTLTLGLSFLF
nr:multicopper oxidase domain-containing protein [Aquicella siphonis]